MWRMLLVNGLLLIVVCVLSVCVLLFVADQVSKKDTYKIHWFDLYNKCIKNPQQIEHRNEYSLGPRGALHAYLAGFHGDITI